MQVIITSKGPHNWHLNLRSKEDEEENTVSSNISGTPAGAEDKHWAQMCKPELWWKNRASCCSKIHMFLSFLAETRCRAPATPLSSPARERECHLRQRPSGLGWSCQQQPGKAAVLKLQKSLTLSKEKKKKAQEDLANVLLSNSFM